MKASQSCLLLSVFFLLNGCQPTPSSSQSSSETSSWVEPCSSSSSCGPEWLLDGSHISGAIALNDQNSKSFHSEAYGFLFLAKAEIYKDGELLPIEDVVVGDLALALYVIAASEYSGFVPGDVAEVILLNPADFPLTDDPLYLYSFREISGVIAKNNLNVLCFYNESYGYRSLAKAEIYQNDQAITLEEVAVGTHVVARFVMVADSLSGLFSGDIARITVQA